MKRRDFFKTSAAAAGFVGTINLSPVFGAENIESPKLSGIPKTDNRTAEYLQRIKNEKLLYIKPELGKSYPVAPMPIKERIKRKILPKQGFCSVAPAASVRETLISGNGSMTLELLGNPYSEQILFHHESLLMPWKKPIEAQKAASVFNQVRKLALEGKTKKAVELALNKMNSSDVKQDTEPHLTIPAFLMSLIFDEAGSIKDYLRTVNFENGEIKIFWNDQKGDWIRQTFVSRADDLIVQKLTAPKGKKININISLEKSPHWSMASGMDWGATRGIGTTDPDMAAFTDLADEQKERAPKGVEANDVSQDCNEQRLIYKCILDPKVDNSGYAGVTRIVKDGGTAKIDGTTLIIENASSLIMLTRIEYYSEFSDEKVDILLKEIEAVNPDYTKLLERQQKLQSEILNRVTVDFGGDKLCAKSVEELLINQYTQSDYSPELLKKIYEMGRYWFIINSGKYPSISTRINSTINLQTAGAIQGNLKEGMQSYFNWMEEIAADCRINAKNIFGFKGTSYPLFPDKNFGVNFYYTDKSEIGIWPYWISAGGWLLRNFWDHYLVTGDIDFLRNRVVPAYKGLADFYEDFLTLTDKNGNYIFVPSISPENSAFNTKTNEVSLINATMDISVCREVLTNLINSCETLSIESENISKWKSMLSKIPPYLMETDGTMKEWAWPTVKERYSHRHISHLYGIWPGDEIDPDRTPKLAKAANIAVRKRTFDTMPKGVAGETLAAYFRCHRALVGARLKDNVMVDLQLRQLIEEGYISNSLRCSRETYGIPVPDAQAGIPAIIMEMLLYSRPGVIEVLPALPSSITRGTINGMLVRTFAKVENLAWNLDERTVDIEITSIKEQDITLICRYGIERISASAGVLALTFEKGKVDCELHLPENKTVKINLKLDNKEPMGWIEEVI